MVSIENLQQATAKFCEFLGLRVPEVKIRNTNLDIAAYNEKQNTIFFHSDLLYLTDINFVESIIAHEVAHVKAGYVNQHNSVWKKVCSFLVEKFDNLEIHESLDDYNLKGIFQNLKPGYCMKELLKAWPEMESHYIVGFDTPGGCLADMVNETTIVVRPTLFCSNKEYVTPEDIDEFDMCAEDVLDYIETGSNSFSMVANF